MSPLHRASSLALGALLVLCIAAPASSITITLDYSNDTSGFFDTGTANGLAARARVGEAATFFSNLLTDSLGAITPGPSGFGFDNTWTATFTNPTTGLADSVLDMSVLADEIVVFLGARNLGGTTLGQGGFGGFSASGAAAFLDSITGRGQTGVGTTDVAPWGGSLAFDSVGTNWSFDAGLPAGGTSDFFSVALHEFGHLLGIGGAGSWFAQIAGDGGCSNGLSFGGSAATAANGGTGACVESDSAHFEAGLTSGGQEVAMDPNITQGTRKVFTALDIAALQDVGWQISVPEPSLMLLLGFATLGARLRTRRTR